MKKTMTLEQDKISKIRSGIDAIDDEMLSLIGQRLVLGKSLRAIKAKERAAWAPAREHALLQRLLNDKPRNLPAETLISMWSALISASLMSQGPFMLFCANEHMKALAKSAFPGAPVYDLDIKNWREQVYAQPGAIAVLPIITENQSWWVDLVEPGPKLYVQTCFPKWPPGPAQGICVSADPSAWMEGQVCWAIGKTKHTKPEATQIIMQTNDLVLLQSSEPFADKSQELIPIGNFFPFLNSGQSDDPST